MPEDCRGIAQSLAALFAGVWLLVSAPGWAQDNSKQCPTSTATVDVATLTPALRTTISLNVRQFGSLAEEQACRGSTKQIVLFVGGVALPDHELITSVQNRDDKGNLIALHTVTFDLAWTHSSRKIWNELLGKPASLKTAVSLGLDGQPAVKSNAVIFLNRTVSGFWISVIGIIVLFCWIVPVFTSNLVRDPGPQRYFSWAKTSAAWWILVVSEAYIYVALTTGNYLSVLNTTALTLLGISAATAAAGAIVDDSKKLTSSEITTKIRELDNKSKELEELHKSAIENEKESIAAQAESVTAQQKELTAVQTNTPLAHITPNFFTDILSDANGLSVNRFQMVVWTLILTFIFLFDVVRTTQMPEFDPTLLGLLGISAGTYLGLKIPEPAVPSKK